MVSDSANTKSIINWLFTGCFLVFTMVVIGGVTRLTGSGLSITEWNLIMGTIPPLNEGQWQAAFEKYQVSPQFQKQNFHFELADFKTIFWWEYIHRLIGRLTGIVFIIPFIFFLIRKQIDNKLLKKLLFIFLLGAMQGFIGWYMVKSGLIDNPRVSHYRLATHLLTAFITFGFILWTALGLRYALKNNSGAEGKKIFNVSLVLFFILVLQIMYGAFTAGLKAGLIYNSFPKMGDEWIAATVGLAYEQDGLKSFFENPGSIQFIHRSIAWLLLILFGIILFLIRKKREDVFFTQQQKSIVYLTGGILFCQFLLGVYTLLKGAPLLAGVLHQTGAFILFAAVIILLHSFRRAG